MVSKFNDEHQKGLALVKEYVEKYNSVPYPQVNDDLICTLTKGLKLLGINYVVTPEDTERCPTCKFNIGKVGKKGISLHTLLGINTLCVYCSFEGEEKMMMKHNMGNCECPLEKLDKNGKPQWTRNDCLHLYKGFEEMYNEILLEIA